MTCLTDEQLKAISADSFKGVGPRYAACLERLHIRCAFDLLLHLPFRYLNRTYVTPVAQVCGEGDVLLEVRVLNNYGCGGSSGRVLRVELGDDSGSITAIFFNAHPAFARCFTRQRRLLAFGRARLDTYTHRYTLHHPEIEFEPDNERGAWISERLTPVYHLTAGLPQASLRRIVRWGLELITCSPLEELLPSACNPFAMTLSEALADCHYPSLPRASGYVTLATLPAYTRICYEELIAYQLVLLTLRRRLSVQHAPVLSPQPLAQQRLLQALPFKPTAAQLRVFGEISADLCSAAPMLRLVHGDVGSGKTLVAVMALLQCAAAGMQGALMVPTELLARQHFKLVTAWLAGQDIECALLTASLTRSQRRKTLERLRLGQVQIIVGTHALFQEEVRYSCLALAIIDEHHRFGVAQRTALLDKAPAGTAPHQLAMTATPIPQSMQIALYSDLDISVLDELPQGRRGIQTALINRERRAEVIARVRHICGTGVQVYWVCPTIEEHEELGVGSAEATYQELCHALPQLHIGLVHGQLSSRRRLSVMEDFMAGNLDVLVATTVIEVGVDVPRASIMIIEDADRLGLAQLHQLRGRVGRGTAQSYCLLLYNPHPVHALALQRLQVMRSTTDGFEIAAQDLQLRGPGEVLGCVQTGFQVLRIADLARDYRLLAPARTAALAMLQSEPGLCGRLMSRWFDCSTDSRHAETRNTPTA